MLVVPLEKDVITTAVGAYTVVEYTNLKPGGPAVYARSKGAKELDVIYFFDITKINGTDVEYKKGSHVFNALGKVSRAQNLPQPDDKIVTDADPVEVKDLKLKSKSLGISKGLLVKGEGGTYYRLNQITDIQRALGGGSFDRNSFLAIYKDYLGS